MQSPFCLTGISEDQSHYNNHLIPVDNCVMDAKVATPMNADAFALNLSNHLDQGYVTQLLQSIKEGFNIGYTWSEQTRESPNLKLAINHPDVVSGYLQKECNLGTMQQFSILEIILSLPLCNNATILLTGNNSHFTALQQYF